MNTTRQERLEQAIKTGVFKLQEASVFLNMKKKPYTTAQLRTWCHRGIIPFSQPMPSSHITLTRETLDKLVSEELPLKNVPENA